MPHDNNIMKQKKILLWIRGLVSHLNASRIILNANDHHYIHLVSKLCP